VTRTDHQDASSQALARTLSPLLSSSHQITLETDQIADRAAEAFTPDSDGTFHTTNDEDAVKTQIMHRSAATLERSPFWCSQERGNLLVPGYEDDACKRAATDAEINLANT